MSSKNFTYSEEIVQRLLAETNMSTKTDLAKALGYKSVSGVSNWKRRGIEWNKINEVFPSLDVNYVKFGRPGGAQKPPPRPVMDMINEYASHKDARPPSDIERDQLIEFLQERAEYLSVGLRLLSELEKSRDSD